MSVSESKKLLDAHPPVGHIGEHEYATIERPYTRWGECNTETLCVRGAPPCFVEVMRDDRGGAITFYCDQLETPLASANSLLGAIAADPNERVWRIGRTFDCNDSHFSVGGCALVMSERNAKEFLRLIKIAPGKASPSRCGDDWFDRAQAKRQSPPSFASANEAFAVAGDLCAAFGIAFCATPTITYVGETAFDDLDPATLGSKRAMAAEKLELEMVARIVEQARERLRAQERCEAKEKLEAIRAKEEEAKLEALVADKENAIPPPAPPALPNVDANNGFDME
jgi:hypothetical protein